MKHGLNTDGMAKNDASQAQSSEITSQIIGAAFEVYNVLGYGFLSVSINGQWQVELQLRGLGVELEHKIQVSSKERSLVIIRLICSSKSL